MLPTSKRSRRLLAWLLAFTILGLPVAAGLAYASYWQSATEVVSERDRQLAFLSAARLRDELTKFSNTLQVLARTPEMSSADLGTRRAALRQAGARLAVFDGGVVLLDNFGTVIAVEPERETLIGQDWSNRPYFLRLLGGPTAYYSNAVADGPQGSLVVVVSVPILGARGEFTGALAGLFRLDGSTSSAFYASIVRLRLGQSGSTYVVDGKGWLLYDSSAAGLQTGNNALGIYGVALDGAGRVLRTRDAEGNEVIAAYAPVPGTDWILVVEDDWNILTAPIRRSGRFLLGVMTAGILLPVVGGVMLIRQRQLDARRQEEADEEMRAVKQLCDWMLPAQVPLVPDWEAAVARHEAASQRPAFHDFFLLRDGRLMFVLAGASRASLTTALAMAGLRATVRGAARHDPLPGEILAGANALLVPELPAEETISCLVGVLNPQTGYLCLSAAGSPAPLVVRQDNAQPPLIAGPPLGACLDASFIAAEVQLAPGEVLLLISHDVELEGSEEKDAVGLARLGVVLHSLPEASTLAEDLSAAMRRYVAERPPQSQGFTVIGLARNYGRDGQREEVKTPW